jgi:hypothetical protein
MFRRRLTTILAVALVAAAVPAQASAAEEPWTPVTPGPARPDDLEPAVLSDVAAVSPTDVWAVGSGWSNVEEPLITHWTGAGWTEAQEPAAPDFEYHLTGVDAVSARDVWAAGGGQSLSAPTFRAVAVTAHFDGTAWSMVPVPAPSATDSYALSDIDMVSATDGWAVGWVSGTKLFQPLVLRWRNGRWMRALLPVISGDSVLLNNVYARAADDVWAVGRQGDVGLVLHFDGTQWTRMSVPHSGTTDAWNELRGVTAVSAGEAWAVGTSCVAGEGDDVVCQPLILRLTGGVWRVVKQAGDTGTHLVGVVARSSDDVWAVGYDAPPGVQESNHTEHWNGDRFVTVPVSTGIAPRGGLASALEGVTRIPGTAELWAVGWRDNGPLAIRHG